MKDVFKTLISDFVKSPLPEMVDRNISLPDSPSLAVSLIGARRTGKTFLMFSHIRKLRRQLEDNRLVYINLEDDRLWTFGQPDLALFRDAYYELWPENLNREVWFYFDEVQAVPGWERFIRRMLDTENCHIFVTGSSSSLMSREISTLLGGRTLSIEVFPFSFSEYLRWRDVPVDTISTKGKTLIKRALDDFLAGTSLPGLMALEPHFRQRALQDYLDLIMFKDIAERFRVDNYTLLKRLLSFLIANSANLVSINKIFADFQSQGLSLSKNTLYQYTGYLEAAGILSLLPIHSSNQRVQSRNPYKVMVLDHGLKNLVSLQTDLGRNLESLVYWQLRRHTGKICYWRNSHETDFVYVDEEGLKLINVCADLSRTDTRNRELASLTAAMEKFDTTQARIITLDKDASLKTDRGEVPAISFWKWALSEA
ncbi:MAG: ATP-binding protein [Candidatus Cloacimonetes bacterium]|nr:ATP-binding protein [Candidatus Cloacimonadota bacterium]